MLRACVCGSGRELAANAVPVNKNEPATKVARATGQRSRAEKELAMLILTRRVGETVVIGDNVTVTVLGVKGNQVRLGVNAPREVAVHREEIFERIKREQSEEKPRPHLNGNAHP